MTRRLLALFAPGLLMAQRSVTLKRDKFDKVRVVAVHPRHPRPKNGQCPMCGMLAKPYVIELGPYSWQFDPSRRIDCIFCNNTFRQWAEGKEPK